MHDPPTETRINELYAMVISDLESLQTVDEVERDAVLLRASYAVGELRSIAEAASVAPAHEDSQADLVRRILTRISWELVKVLSDTVFYDPECGSRDFLRISRRPHPWPRNATHPLGGWSIAA